MCYPIRIVSTIQRADVVWRRVVDVGALIMLGTLFGLVILIFALVFRFDPEARRSASPTGDQ
jgi:hypothetical protein